MAVEPLAAGYCDDVVMEPGARAPLLVLTAFAGGFMTMSLEVMGFRVLAPYFGYSVYVFGSLIGLILSALSLGYWLGGHCSSRGMKTGHFALILLAASNYLLLASILSRAILVMLAGLGPVEGAMLATLVLWGPPMVAFAAIAPYIIGLRAGREQPGRSAGWVSAVGTLGALAGTFATSFYLIPAFGTRVIFVGNATAATILSVIWLWSAGKKRLVVAVAAPLTAWAMPAANLPLGTIHLEESAYSRLEVVDDGDLIGLRTDLRSGTLYSGATTDGSLPPFLVYDLFAVPALANRAKQGLLLGLGAGTLARIHQLLNPSLRLTGVEIDPRVVSLGREFFGLDDISTIDTIVIADARPFLAHHQKRYDVIELDVFRSAEIPFYLVSKEFFQLTKTRLTQTGAVVMNVYDRTSGAAVAARIANTLASVFDEVRRVAAGPSSFFLVASVFPLVVPDPVAGMDTRLASLVDYYNANVRTVAYSKEAGTFTDDHAPIETLYAPN